MHRLLTFIWTLFLTAASLAANSTVKAKSGTIVVFGISKHKIVVAADSRVKQDAGEYDDHQCKIIALSDKIAFASTGAAGLWKENTANPAQRITLMDNNEEAKIAFDSVRRGSDDFVRSVALLWGRHVSRIFRRAIEGMGARAVLRDIPEGTFTNGYFFGLSPQGVLVLYMENINRVGDDVSYASQPVLIDSTDTMRFSGHGLFTDAVTELAQVKTQWARSEALQRERQLTSSSEDERDVLTAVSLVQSVLHAHTSTPEIGGPVDSLTITHDGGLRWHSRKKECGN